jgi:hypothetical protein
VKADIGRDPIQVRLRRARTGLDSDVVCQNMKELGAARIWKSKPPEKGMAMLDRATTNYASCDRAVRGTSTCTIARLSWLATFCARCLDDLTP